MFTTKETNAVYNANILLIPDWTPVCVEFLKRRSFIGSMLPTYLLGATNSLDGNLVHFTWLASHLKWEEI